MVLFTYLNADADIKFFFELDYKWIGFKEISGQQIPMSQKLTKLKLMFFE